MSVRCLGFFLRHLIIVSCVPHFHIHPWTTSTKLSSFWTGKSCWLSSLAQRKSCWAWLLTHQKHTSGLAALSYALLLLTHTWLTQHNNDLTEIERWFTLQYNRKCETKWSFMSSQWFCDWEMAAMNKQGILLVIVGAFLLNRSVPESSCDPRVRMLSPGVGLWYPRGEAIGCLSVKFYCDLIHMCISSGK